MSEVIKDLGTLASIVNIFSGIEPCLFSNFSTAFPYTASFFAFPNAVNQPTLLECHPEFELHGGAACMRLQGPTHLTSIVVDSGCQR